MDAVSHTPEEGKNEAYFKYSFPISKIKIIVKYVKQKWEWFILMASIQIGYLFMISNSNSIVFVINSVQTMSGASKVMSFVAEAVTEKFRKVYVIGIQNKSIDNYIPNVEIIALNADTSYKGIWRLIAAWKLRKILKQIKPSVVCAFVSDACVTAKFASLGLDSKFISCERGDPYAFNSIWKFLVPKVYASSTQCVFQIPQARDYFDVGIRNKSVVIPNPFVPKATPLQHNEVRNKTIVSTGRLFEKQKHFSVLIKAFKIVHEKYPEYKLIIYGEGSSRSEYKNQIEQLGLNNCIYLPGFVENASESIKKDGIFVLSSKYEGIPNSLIEAMSMGLPCIATDCSPGGARFLLEDGKNGCLIDIDDVSAMSQGIIKCIEEPEYAKEIGYIAKKSINRFNPDIIKEQWFELFRNVLK